MVGRTACHPQPQLWSPTPDTLRLHGKMASLEEVGVGDSGRARVGLVLNSVLVLQHLAQVQARGDLWVHILLTELKVLGGLNS